MNVATTLFMRGGPNDSLSAFPSRRKASSRQVVKYVLREFVARSGRFCSLESVLKAGLSFANAESMISTIEATFVCVRLAGAS